MRQRHIKISFLHTSTLEALWSIVSEWDKKDTLIYRNMFKNNDFKRVIDALLVNRRKLKHNEELYGLGNEFDYDAAVVDLS